MGADIVINANEADPIAQVKELTEGRGCRRGVLHRGHRPPWRSRRWIWPGKLGRVVMYTSFFPDLPIEISPTKLHSGEQILTGSVNPESGGFPDGDAPAQRKLIDVSSSDLRPGPHGRDRPRFREAVEPNTYRIIVKP